MEETLELEEMDGQGTNIEKSTGMEMTAVEDETLVTKDNQPVMNKETQEQMQTRQSQRVKEQGMQGIKIAEKAMLTKKKKNLEGNTTNSKNSFVVLNNDELVVR